MAHNNKTSINSFFISFVLFSFYAQIFFQNVLISIILGVLISIKFKRIFYDLIIKKQNRNNIIMFRDFLDIFNTSIMSGNNFYESMVATKDEITVLYDRNSKIAKAITELVENLDNGIIQNDALLIFGDSLGFDEARIFAQTMQMGLDSGMEIREVISITKDQLTDQINMELDIRTNLDSSKREFLIMMILPLIIITLLNLTNIRELNFMDYIIRMVVFGFIVFSFYLGELIVNLEV